MSEPRANPGDSVELCAFRVAAEQYALDLRRVEEIIQPPPLTRVPHAPPFVEGVFQLRGQVVPLVDLRKRLGLPPSPPALRPKCIICRLGRQWVAILVDGAGEVLRVSIGDLRPVPRLLSTPARPYVIGVCGAPNELKLLLDLKSLFAPEGALG